MAEIHPDAEPVTDWESIDDLTVGYAVVTEDTDE